MTQGNKAPKLKMVVKILCLKSTFLLRWMMIHDVTSLIHMI